MSENETVGVSNLSTPLKTILLFLSILAIVVPAVLGFVNLDKRQDVLESAQKDHEKRDEKKWDNADAKFAEVDEDIETNKDDIHKLELSTTVIETKFQQILKELNDLNHKIDKWEPVEDG